MRNPENSKSATADRDDVPILICADSKNSPEMRHEVPVQIADPFLYIEREGHRVAVVTGFEVPRLAQLGTIEAIAIEEFGSDEMYARGAARSEVRLEAYARACQRYRIVEAIVPPTFPAELADWLRSKGIRLLVDRELFERRRRAKNAAELLGIMRSQRAAEAAMKAARAALAEATVKGHKVWHRRRQLTSEMLKLAIKETYYRHDVSPEDIIVAHGSQIFGHDPGSGPILESEPIVIDLAPRDPQSGCFADMTRTFVVGAISDEMHTYHRLVREALVRATDAIRAGVSVRQPYEIVCKLFHEHGFETDLSKRPGTFLKSGFFHGLGHGVGLEIHERPFLHRSLDEFAIGDVVTVEPGLYRDGYGGCRLEDLVRVAEEGPQTLTQFDYGLVP